MVAEISSYYRGSAFFLYSLDVVTKYIILIIERLDHRRIG